MNAPHPLQGQTLGQSQPPDVAQDDGLVNLLDYWDIIVEKRWLVALIAGAAVTLGAVYAMVEQPMYRANLLVQVASSDEASKLLGGAAELTTATEMEILRSRMVIGQAVDHSLLYVEAKPRYLPVIGSSLAKRASTLSNPGFLGIGGYVNGTERIEVSQFDVPSALEDTELKESTFRLTAGENGLYVLTHPELDEQIEGRVGEKLTHKTAKGPVTLLVSTLNGKPGAQFNLTRRSRLETIESLQQKLKLSEKGRQSGVIEATLQSTEPHQLVQALNEIGREYVRQKKERRAAEAQDTLAFLDVQLPKFKRQLNEAKEAYNGYRNGKGTSGQTAFGPDLVALDEEAKLARARLQLQLLREGKIDNVRVIDEAVLPEAPVQPKRAQMILALSLALGVIGGAMVALARNALSSAASSRHKRSKRLAA